MKCMYLQTCSPTVTLAAWTRKNSNISYLVPESLEVQGCNRGTEVGIEIAHAGQKILTF